MALAKVDVDRARRRHCRRLARRCACRRAAAPSSLVDRLARAAGETSFGNTGIVQSEAVFPILFPRAPRRDRPRGAQPRSARAYPPWRAAGDRAGDLALFPAPPPPRGAAASAQGFAPARRAQRRRASRLSPSAAGAGGLLARGRLDQGLPHRARPPDGARRSRGARGRSASRRRARPRRGSPRWSRICRDVVDRRRAFHRSADDARSRRARQVLRRSVRQARRPAAGGRRAHARASGRRLAVATGRGAACRRATSSSRSGPGRRTISRGARLSLAVLRQARLSHALRRRGQRDADPPGARRRIRLSSSRRWRAASA